MPIGKPAWPESAFSTASMVRVRIVLITSWSSFAFESADDVAD
jgi:hypothetical protein